MNTCKIKSQEMCGFRQMKLNFLKERSDPVQMQELFQNFLKFVNEKCNTCKAKILYKTWFHVP